MDWIQIKSSSNLFIMKQNVSIHIYTNFVPTSSVESHCDQVLLFFLYTVINGFLQLNKYVYNGCLSLHVCISSYDVLTECFFLLT